MSLGEIFRITKGTKVIIMITFSVSLAAVIFAFFYYRSVNRSEDPRIREARVMLMKFDKEGDMNNNLKAFNYLDSAAVIFRSLDDYRNSFEPGIIYNNKCSSLLMKALYDSTISETEKRTLLELSLKFCDSSIAVYRSWIKEWNKPGKDEIAGRAASMMNPADPAFKDFNFDRLVKRRTKNLILAQTETPRRLSVSLTNRGTIFRHMHQPDSALTCYQNAIRIWANNRVAKSNMSVLMGGQPVKTGVIESLFPPDRRKKQSGFNS